MAKPILQLTTPKTTPSKRQRDHIPALNPLELQAALALVEQTAQLPPAARQQLTAMLQAASTPGSDGAEAATRTLSKTRQRLVRRGERAMRQATAGIVGRGKDALLAMSADEWTAMLDEG